jgi:hypothetical protein
MHIILMQRDDWYKTWYMHAVSYATLTLQNSCGVGYLLPGLEIFHSNTTEKKKKFTYSRMLPYMRSHST